MTEHQAPEDFDPDATRLSTAPLRPIGDAMPQTGPAFEPSPDTLVGRYRIVEKLGEGSTASVYKAYDPSINRPLVIKFLHPHLCADADYRQRFLREARAAGMLAHPNIVTVFDVGELHDRPYIVMELLDGQSLESLMNIEGGVPVRGALAIGMQLAQALDYAHQRGVFHRDIKPANVLRVGDGRRVKIADFGIAHLDSAEIEDKTGVGTIVGTPHYMSPEQATGGKVDGRSDLFAVGVVLYQLLVGRRPFEADNMMALVVKLTREPPTPIDQLRQGVPASLRRIVERCLQKQPDKRFRSGQELYEALRKVRRELDEQEGRRGKPRRIPLKLRLAIGMALVVVITMAVTAAYVSERQYRTMMLQSVENGASISRLIAAESAASALSEDWVGIDVLVQELAKALSLKSLSVTDAQGTVRVSSDAPTVGKPVVAMRGEPIIGRDPTVKVQRLSDESHVPVFGFEAPVTFQDKRIGTIHLALPEAPLVEARRESLLLMGLLLTVTAATAGLATYLLVERYSKPLALLTESMNEIAEGRYGYRIAEQRRDEFGEVFRSFDRMAARLEGTEFTVIEPDSEAGTTATQTPPRAG